MREIDALMLDDSNFEVVSSKMATEFTKMYMEFTSLNDAVKAHMN